jgi:hypothetical protein
MPALRLSTASRHTRRNAVVAVGLVLAVILLISHLSPEKGPSINSACPRTKSASLVVPNVIHFIHLDAASFPFVSFVCVLAAYLNQRPERIFIHTNVADALAADPYFARLVALLDHTGVLTVRSVKRPTHVYGHPVSSTFHATDLVRLQLAQKEGGIFLDGDSYLVKSVDYFRVNVSEDVSLGWPDHQFIGTQVLVAKPGSAFVRMWLQSYKDYRSTMWYYNAGELPTTAILGRCPHLVHREKERFGVHNLAQKLYGEYWPQWRDYYAIHLLFRHRSYLVEDDVRLSGIEEFDEENVRSYNRTFGEMARAVLDRLDKL